MPHWRVLNPMSAFPARTLDVNDIEPSDSILAYTQPYRWLSSHYPVQANVIYRGRNCNPDTIFEILEYNDADETVLVALGQAKVNDYTSSIGLRVTENVGTQSVVELARTPNRADMPLTVYPGRIGLSKLQGMFDQLLPIYHNASKLAALEYIAIKQSIFPKEWLVSHPNSPGQARDHHRGRRTRGHHGRDSQWHDPTDQHPALYPGQSMQDRLERTGRLAAGLPAELGGESATNIRTARAAKQCSAPPSTCPSRSTRRYSRTPWRRRTAGPSRFRRATSAQRPPPSTSPSTGKVTQKDYVPNEVLRERPERGQVRHNRHRRELLRHRDGPAPPDGDHLARDIHGDGPGRRRRARGDGPHQHRQRAARHDEQRRDRRRPRARSTRRSSRASPPHYRMARPTPRTHSSSCTVRCRPNRPPRRQPHRRRVLPSNRG